MGPYFVHLVSKCISATVLFSRERSDFSQTFQTFVATVDADSDGLKRPRQASPDVGPPFHIWGVTMFSVYLFLFFLDGTRVPFADT